ncbi:thioredoxin family protein [Nocardioides sp. WS12]|uniref:TlpA family protein disulfide reductase n=1 Tax=Nocardioides sp. WS12 TaxID=2486272 RepID=UPI0015FB8B24|nr:thioredoxin family protein [Nocardioides sp. WS12]
MNPGLLILVLAVLVAVAFGLHRRRVDGHFGEALPVDEVVSTGSTSEDSAWSSVTAALPSAELGEQATLVQFSSAFCAPCRTTRVVLADVADRYDGVAHLEIDAEEHLALVRALDIRRTPTTLILDAAGNELTRAAGAPRREQVLAALPSSSQETS